MGKDKCRVCLSEGAMLCLFNNRDSLMLATKIMSIAKVLIYPKDGLPSTICRKCVKKLDYCIKFVKLCEDSDLKLRASLLETNFKQPTTENKIDIENCCYNVEFSSPENCDEQNLFIDENTNQSHEDKPLNEEVDISVPKPSNGKKKREKQQCFTCGKVMSSRFRLKTHLRTHTGERPFSCPQCDKSFALAQNLKVHLRIHSGEKPLSCAECGATFAHSAGLAAHKRKHAGQTPYLCMLCPRSFRTVGHLQYHVRRHTGEKSFECGTCSRAFITRSDLKQHLLSHTGEKPHVCCICGLRLTRSSHLKRHIEFIHTTKFTCPQCPAKFAQTEDLDKHKQEHGLK